MLGGVGGTVRDVHSKNEFIIVFKHHIMNALWGSGGKSPSALNSSTRWKWAIIFMVQTICSWGKSPWSPLNRRLGKLQSHFGQNSG
jgi:hypothetical protein